MRLGLGLGFPGVTSCEYDTACLTSQTKLWLVIKSSKGVCSAAAAAAPTLPLGLTDWLTESMLLMRLIASKIVAGHSGLIRKRPNTDYINTNRDSWLLMCTVTQSPSRARGCAPWLWMNGTRCKRWCQMFDRQSWLVKTKVNQEGRRTGESNKERSFID